MIKNSDDKRTFVLIHFSVCRQVPLLKRARDFVPCYKLLREDGSFEHPKHMFKLMDKTIIANLTHIIFV